eukprot:CAMPEP_0172072844 /NCGR_PEP_ID=MMETSP1043-20130122/14526_1 /TAXON_ID=464988 /ORGANISM="Hemiselmis andersenii, Strain CCMP441" /LENGTH=58 /DNA_ID=CAMNT_0012733327 /DNA_START=261 /DNA_END=434 /DNA_ORIENTATION=-
MRSIDAIRVSPRAVSHVPSDVCQHSDLPRLSQQGEHPVPFPTTRTSPLLALLPSPQGW